ncbi:DEAD/DEAH box helicase family protein [Aurantibacter crassamenti]|uniref:DEAD/DEAH box helicase n=1 Tax=Aurantibacter crassamenti TaxID=1837375 RepID=UPI0019392D19|nr:DEAD/DEAH box helicase family protein [Aurantibacter crassamenti]MBM1106041.1 DEAD/DEAH box helicase family protein [Aurantibacter crassamenti]
MSDPNTVVLKKSLNITVSHKVVKTNLSFLQPYFTEIEPYYTDRKPNAHKGVISYYGLNGLLNRLNTYISTNKKFDAPPILKGIYKGGTSGQYCTMSAPFLFFDIDVKNEENKPLQDAYTNAAVFDELQKVALLVWRSNSQKGIAGILHVPMLGNVNKTETALHNKIGNAITNYLSNYLLKMGYAVVFDVAQNKFRQIRFLAEQKEVRTYNSNPYTFDYAIQELEATTYNNIKNYVFESPTAVHGSIKQQFNFNNPIDNIILSCGFSKVNGAKRYKHFNTTSSSSGSTDPKKNIFYNHSSSFSNRKVFDPFSLVLYTKYDNDFNAFLSDLKQQGYKEQKPQQSIVKDALKRLKNPNITDKEIFAALFDLINLPTPEKLDLIKENCRTAKDRLMYCSYLKSKNLLINYDAYFEIENYVSEVLEKVLNIADKKKKVILRAETGTGKTTSFLLDFKKHRPNARCLILAPLTVIVEQSAYDYKNIVALTGKSEPLEHTKAKTEQLVFATYEQGTKHLVNGNKFDFIVIDEVHNLFLSNSYKRTTINELTALLEYKKVIGLTGTPNNLFTDVGYSLVSVTKKQQRPVEIVQRVDNRRPEKIVLQHLENVKGKVIFRVNSTQTIQEIKTELIKNKKFIENEILVLYSSQRIKKSSQYTEIINTSKFTDSIKIVLTTGLIDEGININQLGFTDVVFIETEFTPSPEPLKQFFARFRNADTNRKNYHYYKKTNKQESKYWNEKKDYSQKLEILKNNNINDFNTYNDLTNDNNFYYSNRKINTYYLGYEVYTKFVSLFTHYEFNYYLTNNYNLKINIDSKYLLSTIDTSDIAQSKKEVKKNIAEQLYNNWENIEVGVKRITTDKQLKKIIEDIGQPIENELLDFVQTNIKTLERYCRYYYQLLSTGKTDPLEYLTDGKKLNDPRNINRVIKLFETINLIEQPKTKRDKTNQKKILSFIQDINIVKNLDTGLMFKLWNKYKITNNSSYKDKHLHDLISHYTKWKFDNKNQRFKFKE